MDFDLTLPDVHAPVRLHKAADGALAEVPFKIIVPASHAILFSRATVYYLGKDNQPVFLEEGVMGPVLNQSDRPDPRETQLNWPLSSHNLAAIETLRDGNDLKFRMRIQSIVLGLQYIPNNPGGYTLLENILGKNEEVPVTAERWIRQLRDARIRNAIHLEIPDPELDGDEPHQIAASLKDARDGLSGNGPLAWNRSVGSVRNALDSWEKSQGWNPNSLKAIAEKKAYERSRNEQLLLLRHTLLGFCHKAAHEPSQGETPEDDWTRADAQMVLAAAMGLFANRKAFLLPDAIAAENSSDPPSDLDEWLGKSMQKLRKQNPAAWASILRTIHSATDKIGAGMPAGMYEALGELAESHQPARAKQRQPAS